jgi:hypothetical protein
MALKKRKVRNTTLKLLRRKRVLMAGLKPGGVAVKHRGLWSPRREFESLPGYQESLDEF